jgi:hypothetical protein
MSPTPNIQRFVDWIREVDHVSERRVLTEFHHATVLAAVRRGLVVEDIDASRGRPVVTYRIPEGDR